MHQGHGRHLHPEVVRNHGAPDCRAPRTPVRDGAAHCRCGQAGLPRPEYSTFGRCIRQVVGIRQLTAAADSRGAGRTRHGKSEAPPAGRAAARRPPVRARPIPRIRDQRACLAGQRDRPQDRARRLSARNHPAQRAKWSRDLRRQPLGGARGDQDADGQEPAGVPPQDRQLGRAARALEPARSRRARLVRDVARPRNVPAHGAGIPLHHRAGSDRLRRRAAHRRADGGDQPGLPRDGHGDVAAPSAPRPTRAFTWRSCAPPATNCWCRSAC